MKTVEEIKQKVVEGMNYTSWDDYVQDFPTVHLEVFAKVWAQEQTDELTAQHDKEIEAFAEWIVDGCPYWAPDNKGDKWVSVTAGEPDITTAELLVLFRNRNK